MTRDALKQTVVKALCEAPTRENTEAMADAAMVVDEDSITGVAHFLLGFFSTPNRNLKSAMDMLEGVRGALQEGVARRPAAAEPSKPTPSPELPAHAPVAGEDLGNRSTP